MNVRRVNLTLWTATAALAGAAAACAAWGLLAPVGVDAEPAAVRTTSKPAAAQASPDSQLPLAAFEPVWALDLRRPLADATASANPPPPPQGTEPAPPPGAGGPFVLLGTIGESLAMIRTSTGAVEVKGVGDVAQGAKIVAIRPMQVEIDVNGQRMTIAKLREQEGN